MDNSVGGPSSAARCARSTQKGKSRSSPLDLAAVDWPAALHEALSVSAAALAKEMLETRGQAKAQLQQIHALAAQARFASDMPRIRPHPVREHARVARVARVARARAGPAATLRGTPQDACRAAPGRSAPRPRR